MLSENDLKLLDRCSTGELTLLISQKGKDFEDDIQRIVIEKSEITIITNSGLIIETAISIEGVAAKMKDDDWEIREAFIVGDKSWENSIKEKLEKARMDVEKAECAQRGVHREIIEHYAECPDWIEGWAWEHIKESAKYK